MQLKTISELVGFACAQLVDCSDSPALDAEILIAHSLGRNRSYLRGFAKDILSEDQTKSALELIARRRAGEPVAYITGKREFWSLSLKVTPATLIPRPETELLVEQALVRIPKRVDWLIADLGTGSGAIALAIASERPNARLMACDFSEAALAIAKENGRRMGIKNVTFHHGSWLEPLAGMRCEMIVSNPPYVAPNDPHLDTGDLRFEPLSALASDEDGLKDIKLITHQAPDYLKSDGWLLIEHGYDQRAAITRFLRKYGYSEIKDYCDFGGQPRLAVGRFTRAKNI